MTHHDDASTFGDVLAHFGDDGTKDLFRRLLEQALQDLIDAEVTAQIGAVPSIGSVADSYDNALAESVNSLYKTELIYGPDQGPWRTVEEVELATLMWVKWYNEQRIHGYLNNIPPAEYEDAHPAERSGKQLIGNQ